MPMNFRKSFHIVLFVILLLLLPTLLYLEETDQLGLLKNTIDGEDSSAEDCDLEPVDYYARIYEHDKDKVVFIATEIEDEPAAEEVPASSSSSEQVASQTTGGGFSLGPKEQEMLRLVNQARGNAGLSQLQICSELTRAARAKSKDMVDNNYFSHTSPRYGGLDGLLRNFGIGYRSAGENLAMNSSGSVSAAHNSLMNSPGHKANILNSSYNYVGIGIHAKSDGSLYYTQLFVGR